MNTTDRTEIRALAPTELDQVSGGVAFPAGTFTSALTVVVAPAQPQKLKIITETVERSTQTVQKLFGH